MFLLLSAPIPGTSAWIRADVVRAARRHEAWGWNNTFHLTWESFRVLNDHRSFWRPRQVSESLGSNHDHEPGLDAKTGKFFRHQVLK